MKNPIKWVHPRHLNNPEDGPVSDGAIPVIPLNELKTFLMNPEILEIARKAIEDQLVELRDMRIGLLVRNNGLVIKEYDGTESSIIRMGPEDGMRVGLNAIFEALEFSEDAQ